MAAALLARALLVDGQVDEAEEMAAASQQLAGQNLKTAIGWRVARAEVLAARDDLTGAVALAEQAVEIAAGTDLMIDHADACVALATLRARAGDPAGARTARAGAKRLYEQKGATVPAARLDLDEAAPSDAPPNARAVAAPAAPATAVSNRASVLTARVGELYLAGRFEECGRLLAEDARIEDRRSIIGADLVGRAALVANFEATAALGSHPTAYEAIAIRGSTLALGRVTMGFADWSDQFLALGELGADGLFAHVVWFDDDALDDALNELDARFLAGEAAEHDHLVRHSARWLPAINAFDLDAMRELAEPGFRVVDRRRVNMGTVDLDGFLEWWREYADIGDFSSIVIDRQFRHPAVLVNHVSRVVAADGSEITWGLHTIGVLGSTGRTERIEIFDEADRDAARARFDELGAGLDGLGAPAVENAASRVHARVIDVIASGHDDELRDHLAPEFRYDDHRRVVNMGDNDLAAAAEHLAQLREAEYQWRAPTTIAIRGERLALARSEFHTEAGDDTSSLVVVETDEHDRLLSITQLDDDALGTALEELDTRYAAGEAAESAELVRLVSTWISVFEHGDVDRIRDLVAPGFVWVDHQRLGFGTLDVDQIIELSKAREGLQSSIVVSREVVSGRGILFTAANHATDAEGGEVLWAFHAVGVADETGRTTRVEIFGEDDLEGALARVHELGGSPPHGSDGPTLQNTASRIDARIVALLAARADRELAELTAPELHFEDRRHVVNFGAIDAAGLASQIEWLREEGFEVETPQVVAIRGDRLVLSRRNRRTPTGDDLSSLGVIEVDEQGRLLAFIQFDDEALDDAVAELDARYIAGEGAAHADQVKMNAAWMRALNHFDFDAMRALVAPGFTFVDGRPIGLPSLDIETFIEFQRGYTDMQNSWVTTVLLNRDRYTLASAVNQAVDADGGDTVWAFHIVGIAAPDGRTLRIEAFPEDRWDAALARLDALSTEQRADPRSPTVENDATRGTRRAFELFSTGRFDEALELYHPDFERIDRRRTVAGPPITSAAEYIESTRTTYDQFDAITFAPIAVRGTQLFLGRITWVRDDGFHVPMLGVGERNEEGLSVAGVLFDEDDLDAAVTELDARYLAGEGAEHASILQPMVEYWRCYNARDWEGARDHLTSDVTFVDHEPIGAGTTVQTADALVGFLQGLIDLVPDVTAFESEHLAIGDACILSRHVARGTSIDGAALATEHLMLVEVRDGRGTHVEAFATDQLDAALDRFEELEAEHPRP